MAVVEPQQRQVQALLQEKMVSADPVTTQQLSGGHAADLPPLNSRLLEHMKTLDFSFVISDAQHPDMPIVYASDGFYSTTGYSAAEVRC